MAPQMVLRAPGQLAGSALLAECRRGQGAGCTGIRGCSSSRVLSQYRRANGPLALHTSLQKSPARRLVCMEVESKGSSKEVPQGRAYASGEHGSRPAKVAQLLAALVLVGAQALGSGAAFADTALDSQLFSGLQGNKKIVTPVEDQYNYSSGTTDPSEFGSIIIKVRIEPKPPGDANKEKEEQARAAAEAEKAKQQEEEARRAKQEEETRKAKEEEEARRVKMEMEVRRVKQEEEARRLKQQEEEARRVKQEEEARKIKQLQEEQARRMKQQQEEEARRSKQEEEAKRIRQQQAEEARRLKQQEEEARRVKQEEEARKIKQQQEEQARRIKQQQDEEARRVRQEQEARKIRQQQEEEARRKQEEEARRIRQEMEARRARLEAERKAKQEEEARIAKQKAEEDAKKVLAAQARKAEEEKRAKEEAERFAAAMAKAKAKASAPSMIQQGAEPMEDPTQTLGQSIFKLRIDEQGSKLAESDKDAHLTTDFIKQQLESVEGLAREAVKRLEETYKKMAGQDSTNPPVQDPKAAKEQVKTPPPPPSKSYVQPFAVPEELFQAPALPEPPTAEQTRAVLEDLTKKVNTLIDEKLLGGRAEALANYIWDRKFVWAPTLLAYFVLRRVFVGEVKVKKVNPEAQVAATPTPAPEPVEVPEPEPVSEGPVVDSEKLVRVQRVRNELERLKVKEDLNQAVQKLGGAALRPPKGSVHSQGSEVEELMRKLMELMPAGAVNEALGEAPLARLPHQPVVDGVWELVYISRGGSGGSDSALQSLLAGVEVEQIQQKVWEPASKVPGELVQTTPDMKTRNTAILRLGAIGELELGLSGKWEPGSSPASGTVSFERISAKWLQLLGQELEEDFPTLELPVPRPFRQTAEWRTVYLDEDTRISEVAGGVLYLFLRRGY